MPLPGDGAFTRAITEHLSPGLVPNALSATVGSVVEADPKSTRLYLAARDGHEVRGQPAVRARCVI